MNNVAPAKAHAKYSASQSSQWLNCPGVQGMKSLVPKQKSGAAANEGTAAHELLEQCLNEGIDAFEKLDETITIETDEGEHLSYIVDEDMADAVQECIDVVNKYLEEYPHAETRFEAQVDISALCGDDMFGTVDIMLNVPFDKLIIIDYKHGRGVPVPINNNSQLRYYALGAALAEDFEFSTVEMVIVQPRCPKIATFQSETITIEELKAEAERFKSGRKAAEKAANQIEKAGAPIKELLCAGSWCTFCPAQGICPAKFDQMLEVAQTVFDDDFYDEEIEMPDIQGLTEEQLVFILKNGDAVKKFIDKVHGDAHHQAEGGRKIPGYKLVAKKSNAKFEKEDDEVIEDLVDEGFDKEEITRTKLETLGTLRKICGKKLIESMTYKPDTGTTLVPEEDKREAVVPSVQQVFAD
jgi:hypothetical protein